MAQPVWVLSVDLQAKTATFQSGMADAAKSARGAFNDIKSDSGDMGRTVGGNMMEARHGVMLLGEEFGIHLPRALTTFIASIGPIGALMEAAFPFLAIAVGATLLIQHLVKMHEEGEKLTSDQLKFATAAQNAFNSLEEKLLQAGIKADELRNDHLGALAKQLKLIDMQSMSELVHTFGALEKAADVVFEGLKRSWYQVGAGSAGAKKSLEDFGAQYEALLAQPGGAEAASKLLHDKVERETKILAAQKEALSTPAHSQLGQDNNAELVKHFQAVAVLQAMGVGNSKEEVTAQEQLVSLLNDQVAAEQRVADIKKLEGSNATTTVAKEGGTEAAAAARAAAEATTRIQMQQLEADKAIANARLTIQRASIAERTQSDIGFADAEMRIQLQGNAALMAALDKGSKDYNNNLKAAREHAAEIIQQHTTHVAEITSRGTQEQSAKDLADVESGMRESIEATETGSRERLAAIDAAIRRENALNLGATRFYKELQQERIETLRQATAEESKLRAEAGAEAASHEEKMGALVLAAEKEHQALLNSIHRVSAQQIVQQETTAANQEYQIKMRAFAQEIAALDKHGKDYENKLKALQNKEAQLTKAHENELTAIKDKAEEERNSRILSADQRFNDAIASGMTQVLMGHKSFASQMTAIGNQVVSGMLENAIKSILMDDMTKERDAAAAARKAYLAGSSIGGPAGLVLGPVMAAAAFTAVMAFEDGTDNVPGVGNHDTVPAMLTPGEGVVPGGVMDGLRKMVNSGGLDRGNTTHLHFRPTYHLHALDGDSMDKVLQKHSATVSKHVQREIRKLNQ